MKWKLLSAQTTDWVRQRLRGSGENVSFVVTSPITAKLRVDHVIRQDQKENRFAAILEKIEF